MKMGFNHLNVCDFQYRGLNHLELYCTHTGKCIRRFGGIYAYCRYFIDRKW